MPIIDLNQDELKTISLILQQVQLIYKDSKKVNVIIDKLDTYIEKPATLLPTDVMKQTKETIEPIL